MTDPIQDVLDAMAIMDANPAPEPMECHTTPAGFAAMRSLLGSVGWTERAGAVLGHPAALDRILVFEDPDLTGNQVEFRKPDGAVVASFNLTGVKDPDPHKAGNP